MDIVGRIRTRAYREQYSTPDCYKKAVYERILYWVSKGKTLRKALYKSAPEGTDFGMLTEITDQVPDKWYAPLYWFDSKDYDTRVKAVETALVIVTNRLEATNVSKAE